MSVETATSVGVNAHLNALASARAQGEAVTEALENTPSLKRQPLSPSLKQKSSIRRTGLSFNFAPEPADPVEAAGEQGEAPAEGAPKPRRAAGMIFGDKFKLAVGKVITTKDAEEDKKLQVRPAASRPCHHCPCVYRSGAAEPTVR